MTFFLTEADYSTIRLHSLLVDTQNVSGFFSVINNPAVDEYMWIYIKMVLWFLEDGFLHILLMDWVSTDTDIGHLINIGILFSKIMLTSLISIEVDTNACLPTLLLLPLLPPKLYGHKIILLLFLFALLCFTLSIHVYVYWSFQGPFSPENACSHPL